MKELPSYNPENEFTKAVFQGNHSEISISTVHFLNRESNYYDK